MAKPDYDDDNVRQRLLREARQRANARLGIDEPTGLPDDDDGECLEAELHELEMRHQTSERRRLSRLFARFITLDALEAARVFELLMTSVLKGPSRSAFAIELKTLRAFEVYAKHLKPQLFLTDDDNASACGQHS